MPKIQNQITMRKFASSYNPLFRVVQITIRATARIARNTIRFSPVKRRKNVVYNVTNVEQHELFRFDASRPLPDVIPKWADLLAVVEGVLSRFFQPTASARAIRHVCQARLEVQAAKGQRIPNKSPGERELEVVQEARSWRPIPVRADLLRRPAVPLAERIRSGTHH